MKANERENGLYESGKRCAIDIEESYMMSLLVPPSEGKNKLLDLGCGSGEITRALGDKGYSVRGVDFSSSAIDIAKKAGIDCQIADLDEGIPESDGEFDVVWAGDVVEHVFDPIGVLKEVARVLKQGGIFYATIPYDLNWKTRIRTAIGKSYQENVYKSYGQFKHHTFFSEDLMRYMYGEAGLAIRDILYVAINPINNKKLITGNRLLRLVSTLMIVVAEPSLKNKMDLENVEKKENAA